MDVLLVARVYHKPDCGCGGDSDGGGGSGVGGGGVSDGGSCCNGGL